MHTNKRKSSQSKTINNKNQAGKQGDLFDTSLLNITAIVSYKYLSRTFQLVNEQGQLVPDEFSKFGNKTLKKEKQIRMQKQAQTKKNEKRQMTDRDRAEINT